MDEPLAAVNLPFVADGVETLAHLELLDDEGELDRDALMDVCDSMKKTCEMEDE